MDEILKRFTEIEANDSRSKLYLTTSRVKAREINIELESNKVEIQEGDDLFSKLRLNL